MCDVRCVIVQSLIACSLGWGLERVARLLERLDGVAQLVLFVQLVIIRGRYIIMRACRGGMEEQAEGERPTEDKLRATHGWVRRRTEGYGWYSSMVPVLRVPRVPVSTQLYHNSLCATRLL